MTTAATGMEAQQTRMDIISNNLANVNTNSFKKDQAHFEDLLYQTLRMPGGRNSQGATAPAGIQIGHGARLVSVAKDHRQGELVQTGNPFDLGLEGRGFFRLSNSTGTPTFTRDGSFKTDAEGRLVTHGGDQLDPPIEIPPETIQVIISREGVVTAFRDGEPEGTEIGRIELVDFPNPSGLETIGHNQFRQSQASGEPLSGYPGVGGIAQIGQGFLEHSNVKVVEEMIALISTQRAYEINSKVIETVDQMMQNITRIR
jgi:flagellar basal-body rod protein FlgG